MASAAWWAVPGRGRRFEGITGGDARARQSYALRRQAAAEELAAAPEPELANGDERRYPNFIGNYSKGLPHNPLGEVDRSARRTLLAGLEAGSSAALEAVPLGGDQKRVNPMAGVAFDLEGRDIQQLAPPPAPPVAGRGGRAALPAGKIGAKGREIPQGGPPPGSEFGAAPAKRSAGLGPGAPKLA